jgi:DNA-binding response OmpR family regulator
MTPAAKRPRLLVVDDNAGLAENLREILEDAGYTAHGAGSCALALEAARDGFDVALVDLRLPDGDGTALAPQLKELSPDGEVVLLTGFATLESAVAAVRAGACAYLVKPCATQELLVTVEQAMRQVRLHHEKRELARRAQVAEKLAAVGTMTAGLSHEIRNPLNAAALQLSVLDRRVQRLSRDAQGPLLEPLHLVRDEIRRLDHILEDFLQFARPREFVPRPVDLPAVLARVLDLLEGEAERRGLSVRRDLGPVPPWPATRATPPGGDEPGLNALDAMARGGA